MPAIGMMQQTSCSEIRTDQSTSTSLLTACFAPAAIYILIYGDGIHFTYLFVGVVMFRLLLTSDMSAILENLFMHQTTPIPSCDSPRPSKQVDCVPPPSRMQAPIRAVSASRYVKCTPQHSPAQPSFAKMRIVATPILSADSVVTKLRRSLLNKLSPDKLDEISAKLLDTFSSFNFWATPNDLLHREVAAFINLVFAACTRQTQYIAVFAELLWRTLHKLLRDEQIEDILTVECQAQWSGACLLPVEKSKGWTCMSEDDRTDARSRHKSKQLATAEFCGLLASRGLIAPAYPLSWLAALLEPVVASSAVRPIVAGSSLETVIEIICSGMKGLGPSEREGLFTDMDSMRFDLLCNDVANLKTNSARTKCLIQDTIDLRASGWTLSSAWKQDLLPTKRTSIAN